MILDKFGMVADGLAHDGTVSEIDLGTDRSGPGEKITMFASGVGLVAATGILVTDSDTSGGTFADVLEIDVTSAELNNGGIEFSLPSNIRQFVKVDLVGTTSAGTWSSGVVLKNSQTNK